MEKVENVSKEGPEGGIEKDQHERNENKKCKRCKYEVIYKPDYKTKPNENELWIDIYKRCIVCGHETNKSIKSDKRQIRIDINDDKMIKRYHIDIEKAKQTKIRHYCGGNPSEYGISTNPYWCKMD